MKKIEFDGKSWIFIESGQYQCTIKELSSRDIKRYNYQHLYRNNTFNYIFWTVYIIVRINSCHKFI